MESAIVLIIILVFSIILHEVAHGYMADYLGDPTARYAGRLTLNPIPHIDLFGSIILPTLMVLSSSPIMFGWAKPVPFNPYNLKRGGRWAEALVAFAGPATNMLLAVIFALILRFGFFSGDATATSIMGLIIYINVLLTLFNLIPIPPLDGSKVLSPLLPSGLRYQYEKMKNNLEQQPFLGFGILVVFILVFGDVFHSVVSSVVSILIG
jgi:Zn-dependent protease